MTFRPLLLAHPWTPKVDPTGWWMSEKLDGVRAYWDGVGALWSRAGNVFAKAPAEYLACLPQGVPLDGELFLAPGRFNDTIRAVKGSAGWGELRYVVFDAPYAAPTWGTDTIHWTFERRMDRARAVWSDVAPQTRCESPAHLASEAAAVVKRGGEGVMLRKPGSLYEGKRSRTLLKVKAFHDCEATVVDVCEGKGKHAGRMGYVSCRLADGVRVDVGTGFTDAEREEWWSDPTIVLGSKTLRAARITIRYQELTPAGVPRFPVFVARRDYE